MRTSRRYSETYSDNDAEKNEQLMSKPRREVSFKPKVNRITSRDGHLYDSSGNQIPDLGVQESSLDDSSDDDDDLEELFECEKRTKCQHSKIHSIGMRPM